MRCTLKYVGFWLRQVRTAIETAARHCSHLTPAQNLRMSQIGANVISLPSVVLCSCKDSGMSEIQLALFNVASRPRKRAGNVFKA